MPISVINAVNTYNFKIDMQCPQCGAPVVLDETECIIQCGFCRTRNILHSKPYPCYVIAPGASSIENADLLFVPYWRFKGLEFRLGEQKTGFKVIDYSHIAVQTSLLPRSLGLRSQTQKLQFLNESMSGGFIESDISRTDLLKKVSDGTKKSVHVGEILSLIYMPFFQRENSIYDGLTGKIVSTRIDQLNPVRKLDKFQISFSPGVCPNCGWDLEGKTDSLALHCYNCTTSWLIHNQKLERITTQYTDEQLSDEILLPFWQFQVNFNSLSLESYADFIKLTNQSIVIQKKHQNQLFRFWIPAFKINPKLFLRIGRQTTFAQLETTIRNQIPKNDFHPADLPLEEGFQAIFPILMEMAVKKKELWATLVTERLTLNSAILSYLPFKKTGSELIQKTLGVSLPVNSLRFGRNI